MNALQRPPEVQAVLDEHLDAVERVLLDAGLSRVERQAICDAIQTQAADMLESRGIVAPTAEDVRTVVAEMDPPGSYRESAAPASKPAEPTRLHPAALWSVILPVVAFLLMFMPFGPKSEGAGLTFLGTTTLIAIVLGVVSIVAVRGQPNRFHGIGLAAIGICLLPAIFLAILAIYQWGPSLYSSSLAKERLRAFQLEQQRVGPLVLEELIQRLDELRETAKTEGSRGQVEQQIAETQRRIERTNREIAANRIVRLTNYDEWIVRNREIVEGIAMIVVLLPVISLSGLVPWLIYRRCRPPAMLRSDVRD